MKSWRDRLPWTPALLAGAVALAYLPALRAGFVWDDANFALRTDLRPLSGLWRIWTDPAATEQYFPALHSLFWVEGRLWGAWAPGYHAVSVALHACSAWLLVCLLRRLGIPGARLAGFLFALHPVCVESVAWIAEQKNTLSTALYLAAALSFLRWRDPGLQEGKGPGWRGYASATALFGLAVLSKSAAATLPAALLVVAWWRNGRVGGRRDLAPLLPWFAIGAASGFFTAWVERRYIGAEGGNFDLGFAQRLLLAGRAFWFYLGHVVVPVNLAFIYPRSVPDPASALSWGFPLAFATLLGVLWALRRRSRGPLAAALLFAGTLFPTLGFLNIYGFTFSFVADHWQYLAMPAPLACLAAGWSSWRAGPGGRAAVFSAGLVLAVLGALTWSQCRIYRDEERLYRAILERNPSAWMAHANLGVLLAGRGEFDRAVAEYKEALRLNPGLAEARNNLGNALAQLGRYGEAAEAYGEALRLWPGYPAARRNLARARYHDGNEAGNRGLLDEAVRDYDAALDLEPGFAPALANRGFAFANQGRLAEALRDLGRAIEIDPAYADARDFLGFALERSGRLSEAAAQYREALRLNPADAAARDCLARLGAGPGGEGASR